VTWRPTPLNLSFLTLIGWALFLGALTGYGELVVVAIPLVVALAVARRPATPPEWELSREVSAHRLFEDEGLTVTLTLRAHTALPLIELLEPLPPPVRLERGRNHAFFSLRAGEQIRWTFALRCPRRQRLRLGGPYVRLWGPLGLSTAETRHRESTTVAVYPRVTPLRRLPRAARTQTFVGNHVSPVQGDGIEPGDIRAFVPGDRIRHVNWRATLRLGALHVTQHHRERNADVVLLLDTLSAVGPGGGTVLDAAVSGAASLAAAYLGRRDRVGLIEYGGVLRWLRPGSGRAQLQRLLDTLIRLEVVFTYVTKDLDVVPSRVLPPQALVIALSPMLDTRFVKVATDLAARRIDLIVVAVSPIAATRAAVSSGPIVDAAARLWALERRAWFDDLRRKGLTIVEWDGLEPLDIALAGLRGPRRRRVVLA
jgi:uncharacterized protein (DUF58 family)